MAWRAPRRGEKVPVLLLPEEYVKQPTVEDNQLDDPNPDRPRFWQSGDGTVEMPYYIVANAREVRMRIGADELRDMAREMHKDALKSGLRQKQEENRAAWNEALLRSFEQSTNKGLNSLAKRLKFG